MPEHEAVDRGRGVDLRALTGEHSHAHATPRQVLHGIDQVGERPAEAVELPDDEHVVLPAGRTGSLSRPGRSSRTPNARSW